MIDITKTTLLSADDICSRLSVSRSTLDRWRKLTGTPSPFSAGGFQTQVNIGARSPSDIGDDVGLTPFPQPAMNVGGSPRWSADDVNTWLIANKDKKNRRGFNQGAE